MRLRLRLAALAALVMSNAAQAAVVEEFKAEDWDGLAFTSNETGKFTHCSVYASYRNGSTLYISYEVGDTWFFSVANDSWKLSEGGSFAIKFKVDRRGEIEGTGTALGTNQIGLPVEAYHPFVGQLRRGNRMVISFQNKDYAFELSNSNRAMNAAQDCVRRHVALGTSTPIMSRKPDEQPAQESEQAQQQPATEQPAASADESAASDDSDKPAKPAGAEQVFGPWSVTATEDDKGSFVNCTAYDMQGGDQIILSYFPDKVWTFGLYRPDWKLDTNQTYYIWYNVDAPADARDVVKRPVEAAAATRIFFEVSDVEDIMERIENGSTLNIQFRGVTGPAESYSYPLDQVRAAFEATRKCIADHSGGDQAQTSDGAASNAGDETVSKEGGTKGKAEAEGSPQQPAQDESSAASGESDSAAASEPSAGPAEGGNTPPAPLPVLGEKKLEDLTVSGWQAGAYGLADGSFTHCSINAEYQNGATLGVALTVDDELLLVVKHQDWSLTPETWVPINYTLKGSTDYSKSGQAQAIDSNVVMTDLGTDDDIGEIVAAAREIDVEAEGKSLSFDTSDIGPAMLAVEECALAHVVDSLPSPAPAAKKVAPPAGKVSPAPPAETPPPATEAPPASDGGAAPADSSASAPGEPAAPEDDAALHTEAAGYTTALLIRSGYANHIVLNGEDVPEALRGHRAVWKIGDLVGLTDLVAGSVDEIKSQVFASDTQSCSGEITTTVEGASGDYEHLHTVCKKPDSTLITVHYMVIPRAAGGSYMLSLIDTGDGTQAGEIADKVYSVAVPM